MPSSQSQTSPASLSHLIIFNPTLTTLRTLPNQKQDDQDEEERDKDLEDDLREAAQILFYTSRQANGVSRDKMLRQVGLAKGLMGFTDMVTGEKEEGEKDGWWSVRSHRNRMIIYSPEPDFFIYVNIELAHQPTTNSTGIGSKVKSEPTSTAQGLSDHMIVTALKRGYDVFCLLHSSFPSLLPPTPILSSTLDKYWTRFAFSFESTYLSSPTPFLLWLGGNPPPPQELITPIQTAITIYLQDAQVPEKTVCGIITKSFSFPSSPPSNPALLRYLTSLLRATLPIEIPIESKPDTRQTLGFGLSRRNKDDRTSSWSTSFSLGNAGSWVPSLTGGKGSPSSAGVASTSPGKGKGRWPSLGLGEAMQSVGGVFGLGSGSGSASASGTITGSGSASASAVGGKDGDGPTLITDRTPEPGGVRPDSVDVSSLSATDQPKTGGSSEPDSHRVEQSRVALPDLQAAVQNDPAPELEWEGKNVWIPLDGTDQWEKRRLAWIIRDSVLLYLLYPIGTTLPYPQPDTPATLSFLSKLTRILTPERNSIDTSRPATPVFNVNSTILHSDKEIEVKGPEIDSNSMTALSELRGVMLEDISINEMYARTSASRFVVAKRFNPEVEEGEKELYMLVGRKDASLTDAEYAVRGFAKSHPEFA